MRRRFDHGGAKLVFCHGRQLTALRPWLPWPLVGDGPANVTDLPECETTFMQGSFPRSMKFRSRTNPTPTIPRTLPKNPYIT